MDNTLPKIALPEPVVNPKVLENNMIADTKEHALDKQMESIGDMASAASTKFSEGLETASDKFSEGLETASAVAQIGMFQAESMLDSGMDKISNMFNSSESVGSETSIFDSVMDSLPTIEIPGIAEMKDSILDTFGYNEKCNGDIKSTVIPPTSTKDIESKIISTTDPTEKLKYKEMLDKVPADATVEAQNEILKTEIAKVKKEKADAQIAEITGTANDDKPITLQVQELESESIKSVEVEKYDERADILNSWKREIEMHDKDEPKKPDNYDSGIVNARIVELEKYINDLEAKSIKTKDEKTILLKLKEEHSELLTKKALWDKWYVWYKDKQILNNTWTAILDDHDNPPTPAKLVETEKQIEKVETMSYKPKILTTYKKEAKKKKENTKLIKKPENAKVATKVPIKAKPTVKVMEAAEIKDNIPYGTTHLSIQGKKALTKLNTLKSEMQKLKVELDIYRNSKDTSKSVIYKIKGLTSRSKRTAKRIAIATKQFLKILKEINARDITPEWKEATEPVVDMNSSEMNSFVKAEIDDMKSTLSYNSNNLAACEKARTKIMESLTKIESTFDVEAATAYDAELKAKGKKMFRTDDVNKKYNGWSERKQILRALTNKNKEIESLKTKIEFNQKSIKYYENIL